MRMLLSLSLLLFISPNLLGAKGLYSSKRSSNDASANAGLYLLNSFECSSIGSNARDAINNIKNLKEIADSISEDEKSCKRFVDEMRGFPDVSAITNRIESDGLEKEIREQEKFIAEAYDEIKSIESLPEDMREYYPDTSSLVIQIRDSREDLVRLKSSLRLQKQSLSKENYISGVNELDRLSNLMFNLQQEHSKCLEDRPDIGKYILNSLVGISGFFLSEPLGMITSTGSKILQNLFANSEDFSSLSSSAFKNTDKLMIFQGVSCAMENLNKNMCKTLKEKKYVNELRANLIESEGKHCENCTESKYLSYYVNENKALRAMDQVVGWLSDQKGMGGYTVDYLKKLASDKEEAESTFSSMLSMAYDLREKADAAGPDSGISDISYFEKKLYYLDEVFNSIESLPMEALSAIKKEYTKEQFDTGAYLLLFPSSEVVSLKKGIESEIKQAIESNESSMYRSKTSKNLNSAYDDIENYELETKPFSSKLRKYSGAKAVNNFLEFIEKVKGITESSLVPNLSTVQKKIQIDKFFVPDDAERNSIEQSMEDLKAYVDFVNSDEGFRSSKFGTFFDDSLISQKIKNVLAESKKFKDDFEKNKAGDFESVQTAFLTNVGKMMQESRSDQSFSILLNQISNKYNSYLKSQLSKGKFSEVGKAIADGAYMDAIKSSAQIDGSLLPLSLDLASSVALSKENMNSFETLFSPYIDLTLEMMDDKAKNGIEDISLAHSCMQLLGIPNIPKSKLSEKCKGRSLKGVGGNLDFDNYVSSDFETRVCVYHDFMARERAKEREISNKKSLK